MCMEQSENKFKRCEDLGTVKKMDLRTSSEAREVGFLYLERGGDNLESQMPLLLTIGLNRQWQ